MKQTAVEWLLENLISEPYSEKDFEHNKNCWDKAELMEKEQIISAFNNGEFFASDYYHPNNSSVDGSETYYNETYGGKK